jgi:hypothetical protein
MPLQPLHLRPQLRLQGRRLQLQARGAPLSTAPSPVPEPANLSPGSGLTRKDIAMRMLFIMASSLVLAFGLRLVDPPVSAAAPSCCPAAAAR